MLALFITADAFYVHTIAVGGLQTLTKEEVFALTDVANLHLFWVNPEAVRENLLASPTIANASVLVGWPPNMVQIVIQEREPALVWEQSGVATWIDLQGQVMQLREDRDDLLRVVVEDPLSEVLGPNSQVDPEIVNGALRLHELLVSVDVLRYHGEKGLGFRDLRGWDAWFGQGLDMSDKILVYNALVENLIARGIQPSEVSVANPQAAYYSVLGGL